MAHVLTIGSSVIDIFIHSDEFQLQSTTEGMLLCQPHGGKIDVSGFALHTGGGGSNTAVGFARMGHAVQCVSELGKDAWSDIIVRDLEAEQVGTQLVIREKKEETGVAVILVAADGGRTILVRRGASSQIDAADVSAEAIQSADWIHLSSISGRIATLQHIFNVRMLAGKTQFSWNPGISDLEALARGDLQVSQLPVQVLFLNRQEWEVISEVQTAILQQIPEVIVTDGAAGGELYVTGRQEHFSVQKVDSVDDTGAGDAFATGYVAARLEGNEPLTALEWAKANSSSVVQKVGAKPGLLTKSALEQAIQPVS